MHYRNGREAKSVWRKLCDLFRRFFTVLLIASTLCGCVRTVYVSKQPDDLRCVRFQLNGVDGVWIPYAWFRSIRANADLMLDLMHEAEIEAGN